jgi:hypothetical protein
VDFFARKIRRLRPGSHPRSWVPEARLLTTRPPKPLRSPVPLRDNWRMAVETKTNSLYVKAGLLYWGPWRLWRGRFLWRASFHRIRAGEPGRGSGTWDVKRWMEGSRNGASLSDGALWENPLGSAPLLVTPKDMLSQALEMGVCFHGRPAFDKHERTLLFYGLWEKG